jgi:hypothetical protein
MKLNISNAPIISNTWQSVSNLSQLQVTWDFEPGKFYSLIIYDVDAPYPESPSSSPYIHLLIINILGNDISSGRILLSYSLPSPPSDSQPHRYLIYLYKQQTLVPTMSISSRKSFPLDQFISQYELYPVEYEMIVVDPSTMMFYLTTEEPSVTFNSEHPLLMGNTTLSNSEQNFAVALFP